ncbi:MAG: hypothetical protein ACI3Y0_12820 [Prevotella sp.]
MKKSFLLALFTLLCFSMGNAQENENPFKVIRIDSVGFRSLNLLTDKMQPGPDASDGDKLELGILYCDMIMKSSGKVDSGAELPADCNIYFSLSDETGNKLDYIPSDAKNVLKKAQISTLRKLGHSMSTLLFRGGNYDGLLSFPAIDYESHHKITIYDDPIIRRHLGSEYCEKVDTTFNFYFYSGYPYDKTTFTGDEWAKCSVYSIDENKVPTLLSEKEIKISFKDATTETIELVDTLTMKVENAEVGDYMVKLESNWTDNGNQEFYYTVVSSPTAIRSIEDKSEEEQPTTLSGVRISIPKASGIYICGKRKFLIK